MTNTFSPLESATRLTRSLGLETLEARRKRNKIITFHKIYYNNTCLKLPEDIRRPDRNTRGHTAKLTIPKSRTNAHLYSFFPSTVRQWNKLPSDLAENDSKMQFRKMMNVCPMSM